MGIHRGLYAYGITRKSSQHLDIAGIDKKNKVYPVERGDICVVVSEVDVDQFQSQIKRLVAALEKNGKVEEADPEAILQAHEGVVETLMKETTIVPFKFGMILRDEQAAAKLLQDGEEVFQQLIAKFSGKVEWGLKAYVDKQALMEHIVQTEPKLRSLAEQRERLSKGAAYLLGKKVDEEVQNHVAAFLGRVSEEIFQTVGEDAYEAKLNDSLPQTLTGRKKEMILNAAYLIEGEKVDALPQKGKSFLKHYDFMGLDLEFSGPWPPYNFV